MSLNEAQRQIATDWLTASRNCGLTSGDPGAVFGERVRGKVPGQQRPRRLGGEPTGQFLAGDDR